MSTKTSNPAAASEPPKKRRPMSKRRRRRSIIYRTVIFSVLFILVLSTVLVVVFQDQLNLDALRRAVSYRGIERNDTGQSAKFRFESDLSDRFASYQNGLLIASSAEITLLDQKGQTRFSQRTDMAAPTVCAVKDTAVVYDAGGPQLVLLSGTQASLALTLDNGLSFYSAGLNDNGYLTTVSQAAGYKAVVNVYNDKQEHVFSWNSSSHFVSDAAVFNDNQTMAAVTVGLSDARYQSTVVLYRLNSEDQLTSVDLGDQLVLSVEANGDLLCIVTEEALVYIDRDGTQVASYSYQNDALDAFSLQGNGFALVALRGYQAGSSGQLVTVDNSGDPIAARPLSENVIAISAAGRYVTVLYTSHLEIYDKDLDPYATLERTDSIRTALMRPDGSVMCVGSNAAWLYLP